MLAGGKSSRMGADKAGLILGGQTFLARAQAALEPLVSKCLVSGNGIGQLPDPVQGFGPVAAIAAGLRLLDAATGLLVLACDLPLVESTLLERLLAPQSSMDKFAHVFHNQQTGKLEMTAALYWRGALPFFEMSLAQNQRKLNQVLPVERIHKFMCGKKDAWRLLNCNTPEDYALIRQIYQMRNLG